MQSFQSLVEAEFIALDQLILYEMSSEVGLIEEVAKYLINSGGKRLRPLCLFLMSTLLSSNEASGKASDHSGHANTEREHAESGDKTLGGENVSDQAQAQEATNSLKAIGSSNSGSMHQPLVVWYGAVIEFIHTATLLHDDVVDRSDLRRGRPTANANWGNSASVLVGDFLYSRAFQMMVKAAGKANSLAIIQLMSNATNIISEGEVLQLVNANTLSLSEDDYYQVAYKKTAVLFEAACQTACLLHGYKEDDEAFAQAGTFGRKLGVAFQIMDDVLDYSGESAKLGKNTGDDIAEGKVTLPLIYALKQLENGGDQDKILSKKIVTTLKAFRNPAENAHKHAHREDLLSVDEIITIVDEQGGLRYSKEQAGKSIDFAKTTLAKLPGTEKDALHALAEFAIARQS